MCSKLYNMYYIQMNKLVHSRKKMKILIKPVFNKKK